jgi:hypothetical protein
MKLFKFSLSLILIAFFTGCEIVEPDKTNINELDQALEEKNKGVLLFKDNTYIFNENSENTITKFVKDEKNYEFKYIQSSLNINEEEMYKKYRTDIDSYRINNQVTGEYIDIFNLKENKDGSIAFDIKSSSNITLNNLKLFYPMKNPTNDINNRTEICYWCISIPLALIDAALDLLSDDFDSNCSKAISSCGTNGVANIEITEGWFSSSCTVECK